MKKILSLLLIICICFCAVGCNKVTDTNSSDLSSTTTEIETETVIDEEESSTTNTTTEESKIESTTSNTPSENTTLSQNTITSSIENTTPTQSTITNSSETPSIPSTPEVTMPEKLTAENINDVEVFKYFANNIYTNSDADITYIGYRYNNQLYWGNINDFEFFIFLLNSDYVNKSTYDKLFSGKTEEDFQRMSNFIGGILNYAGKSQLYIHFDTIVINNEKREFLKQLHSSIKSGNVKIFADDFFNRRQKYYNYQKDCLIDYFVNESAYNLLSEEDIDSINLLNYYFDIQDNINLYMTNLYYKYN